MTESAARQQRTRRNLNDAIAALDAFKIEAGCTDCGYNTNPCALHFDHLDPATKRYDLGWRDDRSKLTTRTRLIRYIEHVQRYCVVRCANCHAVRTSAEQHWFTRRDGTAAVGVAAWPSLFDSLA